MISKLNITIILIVITFSFSNLNAQNNTHEVGKAAEHHGMKGSSRLTLGLGHTHVSEGKVDGHTEWLPMASWSLNFDYWLSNKWAIGLQNDLILEKFLIEDHEHEIIERKYPWAVVPVVIFKPGKHISFLGGVGAEFSSGHTITMTRLGMEYGWHLPNNCEIGAALVWDGKWNYYNSWGLAFTISKIWPGKHH